MHSWQVPTSAIVLLLLMIGWAEPAVGDAPSADPQLLLAESDPADHPHLENLFRLTERIYSGGEPHGEAAFAELAAMGVQVVVSVDGARPDVEAARRHGLRYVHIPIGYDGVPAEAGRSLARLMRDSRQSGEKVYFHCHHGKHRGPAAAAVACIAAEAADNAAAREILVRIGTSRDYAGLWRDVAAYQPPPPDAQLPELVEVAEVDSMAAAMAQLDRNFDHLKLCQAAGWQPPADHPDLVPAQEALMLKQALRESARNLAVGYDELFIDWLRESETLAATLQHQLRSGHSAAASRTFLLLEKSCQQCHRQYRD